MGMIDDRRRILISGGGPAGAATAFWLAKAGFNVDVVERSTVEPYGQGIDITDSAVDAVRRMGLMETIKANTTGETGFSMIDDNGKDIGELGTTAADRDGDTAMGTPTNEIEIMRGTLTNIFRDAARKEGARFTLGKTIESIEQDERSVKVKFNGSDESSTYHIVIGADGAYSRVRRLTFSEEVNRDCYHKTDTYLAYFSMDVEPQHRVTKSLLQHGHQGRAIWIRPVYEDGSKASCYFLVNASPHHKTKYSQLLQDASESGKQEKQIAALDEIYSDMTGLRDRAIEGMHKSTDFHFARVTQVRLPSWHQSRCALVGDAAYCPTPLTGHGTTAALVGAYILAGELATTPDDPVAAFLEYENKFRPTMKYWGQIPLNGKAPKLALPQSHTGVSIVRSIFWAASRPSAQKIFSAILSLPMLAPKEGTGDLDKVPDYAALPQGELGSQPPQIKEDS